MLAITIIIALKYFTASSIRCAEGNLCYNGPLVAGATGILQLPGSVLRLYLHRRGAESSMVICQAPCERMCSRNKHFWACHREKAPARSRETPAPKSRVRTPSGVT